LADEAFGSGNGCVASVVSLLRGGYDFARGSQLQIHSGRET